MADSPELLEESIREALSVGYRGRLLDRGLARGLIWEKGVVPEGGPRFQANLTEDLLDYGEALLSMALRLRIEKPQSEILGQAFEIAGEAIEAAVHRGGDGPTQGFHRISAATAYHLARLSARAFSMLPGAPEDGNHSPTETAIGLLIRRDFDALHGLFSSRLLDERFHDEKIAERLENDWDFGVDDAVHDVLVNAFMSAIAWFDHALASGSPESAEEARKLMFQTASAASDLRSVNHWWTATLAAHLIDELWGLSFHMRLPLLPDGGSLLGPGWNSLRRDFIQRLRASKRAAVDLWPSQLRAAERAIDPDDDLVVALPTSAGKTRIAELCILRSLANGLRVIYVTPLRALSAQIERDLAETFRPLGFSVSSLYGSAGIEAGDRQTLASGDIVVATPEKLDFALRNDPSIIDDVGLIVFDEGHMLGKGEREVRYETLVQRILRRSDASVRRIVCLSALFPNPEDMKHLVEWIRQDEPGEPIHSAWRPTRQRFGTIEWSAFGRARLEIAFSDEKPFVPGFLESRIPGKGGRKNPFPQNKKELVLGTAWKFVEQGKRVLIYCSEKRSVGALGKLVPKLVRQGMLKPFVKDSEKLRNARTVGEEWLGKDHPAVRCLEYGVALHHASLPRQFLNEVEELLKQAECLLTIASPTLAQGLNLSASVLLVPSIIRKRETIRASEFANVAGRAGRAFVDLEGLILHVVWETGQEAKRAIWKWEKLVKEAKAPLVESGILKLAISIFGAISAKTGRLWDEVADYLTGNSMAWDSLADSGGDHEEADSEWDRELASLDSAILGLIEPDASADSIKSELSASLDGSLPIREASALGGEEALDWLLEFLALRAREIWAKTDESQRRGFYTAGIGLKAGLSLHERLDELVGLMVQIEAGILLEQTEEVPAAVVAFAEIVFGFAPFAPYKEMPDAWKEALSEWMKGSPLASIVEICGETGVDLLEDALSYRLPWAMEAVRVHGNAIGHMTAESLVGLAAQAVEVGSMNQSVIVLIHHGLQSREAARIAVEDTGAAFSDETGLRAWLDSDEVGEKSRQSDWPSPEVRYSWLKFFQKGVRERITAWHRKDYTLEVEWKVVPPEPGTQLVLTAIQADGKNRICSPGYAVLGGSRYGVAVENLVGAWAGPEQNQIRLQYFGP